MGSDANPLLSYLAPMVQRRNVAGDRSNSDPNQPHRSLSLWFDTLPGDLTPRPPLEADLDVDVVIVGGGYTGLWIAYYLTERDPSLRIAVLEREICGFGASGRNGGWCEGELAADLEAYAKHSSHDEAMRLARAMFAAVDEVGERTTKENIDCGFAKGGSIYLARNAAQEKRQRERVQAEWAHGFTEADIRLLSADDARTHANATDVRSGIFFSHCAAVNPAALVRGLAEVVADRGVRIYEQTAVSSIEPGLVTASVHADPGSSKTGSPNTGFTGTRFTVTAPIVVRATEAYTAELPGERRTMTPMYSLMVATEPLDQSTFDQIGLADRQTFADDRYAVVYGQRTDDNRIAFGGRGVPYLFGSRIDPATERHEPTHDLIRRTLLDMFPPLADVNFTHRWGGVLGAPRNWTPSVAYDRRTGLATAGGFVGEGVCAANLAGRTMADLLTLDESERSQSDVATLPWVDLVSRKWEPEPIRWLGIWGTRRAMQTADDVEYRTDRESKRGRLASRLL